LIVPKDQLKNAEKKSDIHFVQFMLEWGKKMVFKIGFLKNQLEENARVKANNWL
jgi:hypothetical protein